MAKLTWMSLLGRESVVWPNPNYTTKPICIAPLGLEYVHYILHMVEVVMSLKPAHAQTNWLTRGQSITQKARPILFPTHGVILKNEPDI